MSDNCEVVQRHLRLVSAIDGLVSQKSSSGDHVCCHSVANKQYDVLCTLLRHLWADVPIGDCLCAVVIGQDRSIISRLVQCDVAVYLRRNIDNCLIASIAREVVLEITEGPFCSNRLVSDIEKDTGVHWVAVGIAFVDHECKVLVRDAIGG